jgi:RNA polymerase sigma-70 factor (ECF subfamily)
LHRRNESLAGANGLKGAGLVAEEAELRAMMLAALSGDAPAYRALLAALSGHLRGYYARRLGAGSPDAEDLVQETLIAIHKRRASYDPKQPLTAWVYAIARYKLIDHFRRARLRQTAPLDEAEGLFATDETAQATAKRDLDRLLAGLPEKSRNLVQQFKIEGRSGAEIAAETGMSETAVKVSVHRSLKSIASRIRGEN